VTQLGAMPLFESGWPVFIAADSCCILGIEPGSE
jgi:hypothetical protein